MTYEIRTAEMWPEADYEMRATADGLSFEGYAAIFDVPSLPMRFPTVNYGRPFTEVVSPGAFTRTLGMNPDVSLVINHDLTALPLARTRSGTLRLTQDGRGLHAEAKIVDSPRGHDAYASIARGDVAGMSFRFAAVEDETQNNVRVLRQVKLGPEISLTNMPAYPSTEAAVRFLAEEVDADPDELADTFRALRDPDARLSTDQRDLLMRAINARTDIPILDSKLVQMRERLAAIA